jgi:hypothetical protein
VTSALRAGPLVLVALAWSVGAARADLGAVLAPPLRPPVLRVPIELVPAGGVEPPAGTPVTTGVPFAEGWLARPDALRLETEAGEPVPVQLSRRGDWPRGGGVRWLGVDFPVVPGVRRYALVEGGGERPAPASPVQVEQGDRAFVVSTGELRAEIPRRGGMLGRVWWRGELMLDPDESNWFTRQADGRHFGDRADPETRAEIELAGPLHTVIRVDGRYRGDPGDPSPRWTARLHFHAGRPSIGISHTFVWIGSAETLQIRELALGFRLARPATRAAVDRGSEPGDGSLEAALDAGRALALVQEQHFAWGTGTSRFHIRGGAAGHSETLADGERAGGWIDAGDGRLGVSLVLRDLWQQHPKELRATSDRLTAFLWSGSGASPSLDLRFPALERLFGPVLLAQLRLPKHRTEWERFRDPARRDPTGFAKSHELALLFHAGDAATGGVEPWADAIDDPPVALPDPRWTASSEVVGRLAPRDESAFPELEARVRGVWDDVFALVEDFGDYGFFGFGSGPHHAYEVVEGRAVATPWRFTGGVEYGFSRAAWLAWLRSGERSYFDLAVARSRYMNDVVICHEDSPSRRKGDWFWSSGVALIPWAVAFPSAATRESPPPALGVLNSFGFFIEHALYSWYLTGDARSLDVVREYAAALKAAITARPGWAEAFVAQMNGQKSRHAFQRLEELAVLWEQLGDPWFREEAERLARLLIVPGESTGLRRVPATPGGPPLPYPYALFYKAPNLLRYAMAVDGEAREAALAAFLRTAEHSVRTRSVESGGVGLRMAYAFALSGDPLFLAHARRSLAELAASLAREPAGARGYRIKLGGVTLHAYDAVVNEPFLMTALQQAAPPPEPFPALSKEAALPAADLVLLKAPGVELHAELVSTGAALEDPTGRPWPDAWSTPPIEYWAEGVEGPLAYRSVRIPGGASAGEYRVRVGREGAATLLSTNAERLVLAAPGGFRLGGSAEAPWYFAVPEGVRRLRLVASDLGLVDLRDAHEKPVRIRANASAADVEVPDDGAGVWSVRARRMTAVAIRGATPFFAHGARERLFVGEVVPSVSFPEPAAALEPWPEGRSGRGLRLSGRDALTLSPGAKLAPGRFERFDAREGTLEFWLRPDWDAALLPYRTFKGLFALEGRDGSLVAHYAHSLDSVGQPAWDLIVDVAPPGAPAEMFRAQRGALIRWHPGAWVHVALVWFSDETGQRWALYVDGQRSASLQGGVKAAWRAFVPRDLTLIRIGSSGVSERPGAIDGVIDGLRLSSAARWRPRADGQPGAFEPPRELQADADTLALFEFEGDVRGQGPGGQPIEAELYRAPLAEERPGWMAGKERAVRGAGPR